MVPSNRSGAHLVGAARRHEHRVAYPLEYRVRHDARLQLQPPQQRAVEVNARVEQRVAPLLHLGLAEAAGLLGLGRGAPRLPEEVGRVHASLEQRQRGGARLVQLLPKTHPEA